MVIHHRLRRFCRSFCRLELGGFGVRPEYGLIRRTTFSYSPHHPKSDAAGNLVRAMMRDRRCDRIGRPSRSQFEVN